MMCAVCGTFHEPSMTSCPPLHASGHAPMPRVYARGAETVVERLELGDDTCAPTAFERSVAKPRTVRVRIAVGLYADGYVMAQAVSPKSVLREEDAANVVACATGRGLCRVTFIEADIPLPEPETIQAEVVS